MIKEDLIRSHRPRALKRSPQVTSPDSELVCLVFFYKHREHTINLPAYKILLKTNRILRDGGRIISKTPVTV